MARKTVNVQAVKELANRTLASNAAFLDQSYRNGVIGMVEAVLHNTDNYKGFKYLPSEWDESINGLRVGYDDTRREYL